MEEKSGEVLRKERNNKKFIVQLQQKKISICEIQFAKTRAKSVFSLNGDRKRYVK
jgi:hypothetical protein